MFGKTSFLVIVLLLTFSIGFAQLFDIEEKKPVIENGIEYGYIIKNEQTKTNKGEEYSRYEITLYATNKSGCTKIYSDRRSFLSSNENPNLIATYNCNNANGKRFTAKNGTVKARDFYLDVKMEENGKEITKSVKAGYIFRNGETIKNNIIVLVPKDERPILQCTVNNLPELQ
jgi:hypothetical protein